MSRSQRQSTEEETAETIFPLWESLDLFDFLHIVAFLQQINTAKSLWEQIKSTNDTLNN